MKKDSHGQGLPHPRESSGAGSFLDRVATAVLRSLRELNTHTHDTRLGEAFFSPRSHLPALENFPEGRTHHDAVNVTA